MSSTGLKMECDWVFVSKTGRGVGYDVKLTQTVLGPGVHMWSGKRTVMVCEFSGTAKRHRKATKHG